MKSEQKSLCSCENVLLNGTFQKVETNKVSCCKPTKNSKPGNFVPLIDDHIDLASSTIVNNPIIPPIRPPDRELKNKKYQVIIGFDKDVKGAIWPEWMKDPTLHALGVDNVSALISSQMSVYVEENVMPLIVALSNGVSNVDIKVTNLSVEVKSELSALSASIGSSISGLNELSTKYETFIKTPATLSTLGVVKSSDRKNQISVLNDGTMEINSLDWSKILPEYNVVLKNPSIEETYQTDGWEYRLTEELNT